ncbi:hypothetical protein [Kordiimonas sp. SCSIO 12610]|uniref:hypothetical protein n=1 Tax=Kordiimonas sp. SCSIO 12610 TaxID=2829597 RepID=UPI002108A49D|nr:hypothetical protein [Kordiimonas sp. SCSIO 12610]UTW56276.1 hypothetical protein KFF44_05080 [Kordiimonas sp. SCSIO 12610]
MNQLAADNAFKIYQPLSSLDLHLSNLGLFGLFNARRKLLVEDHAFKCWFFLKSLKPQYLNIKIATDGDDMVREAMQVRVKYFNWRMKEITGAHEFTRGRRGSRKRLSYFFADPVENVKRQRLWLRPPEGAKFVMLTFERGEYEKRLGFSSKIKLKLFDESAGAKDLTEAFQTNMVSRDRMRMTWFIERLKGESRSIYATTSVDGQDHISPIDMARQMLGHMVYLWYGVEEKRALMVLDDAAHLVKNGFTLDRRHRDQLSFDASKAIGDQSSVHFDYDHILMPSWDRSGLLSNQMRLEAMHLIQTIQAAKTGHIIVREGRQFMARIMIAQAVAKQTGWKLTIDVSETLMAEQTFGEWHRWRTLKDWLSDMKENADWNGAITFITKDAEQAILLDDISLK